MERFKWDEHPLGILLMNVSIVSFCALVMWQMSLGHWILSGILLVSVSIVAAIVDSIMNPKMKKEKISAKVILSAIIGFVLIFGILAIASQESPQEAEAQAEYYMNNQ